MGTVYSYYSEKQLPGATAHGNESGTWSCAGGVTWEQSSGSRPAVCVASLPRCCRLWDAQPYGWHRDLPAWKWANLICAEPGSDGQELGLSTALAWLDFGTAEAWAKDFTHL